MHQPDQNRVIQYTYNNVIRITYNKYEFQKVTHFYIDGPS